MSNVPRQTNGRSPPPSTRAPEVAPRVDLGGERAGDVRAGGPGDSAADGSRPAPAPPGGRRRFERVCPTLHLASRRAGWSDRGAGTSVALPLLPPQPAGRPMENGGEPFYQRVGVGDQCRALPGRLAVRAG